MRQIALAALAVVAFGAPGASAEPKAEQRAAVVRELLDCRKLTGGPERLVCYDAAAAAFDSAEARGDVVVVDRDQARNVRRQAFGFSLPSLSLFEKGASQEELENVEGKLASAHLDNNGRWIVRLEDGAVWRQIDTNELTRTPKSGMAVKIKKAALGSYLAAVDGQRAFRARRVE